MSSFLVLREGDNRNRWRDGQVCPDVGQGIMVPWPRRHGRWRKERKRDERERGAGLGWRKGKSPALDGEREKPPPWMEKAQRRGPGWIEREPSAREKGLVRDWSGKTMNADGIENRI
ncbi:hypothetical protein TNCV_535451 [Trichonephila clavipes]|nr:hypothetical protein TNCV_535451 [Trichonephila clavipes]